jgi:hypothetical protein
MVVQTDTYCREHALAIRHAHANGGVTMDHSTENSRVKTDELMIRWDAR